ncbi:MarR family winged helix-turn-helix transcriptional regulator, partial [Malikia spinosa]|uniref:MarR family winged helix-turn-helix transcriptional regulator n=1 Tax=Malikia spinosa TaxID=86180 RepID=UPI003B02A09D
LEARGLPARRIAPTDRRVRLLALTPAGELLLAQTLPGMERTQERILEPLSPEQRRQFMELLQQLVTANNDLSRAPSERPR